MEKIFLEKPDWKKKEKHHQTGKTKDSSLVSVFFQIKFHWFVPLLLVLTTELMIFFGL
jgi:hypothetical protein